MADETPFTIRQVGLEQKVEGRVYARRDFDPRFRERRRLERIANELLRKGGEEVSKSKKNRKHKAQINLQGRQKAVASGKGDPCPKCGKPMARRQHPETWKPKANQPYYFEFWDVCQPCRHIQHYESAKRWLKDEPAAKNETADEAMTREWRSIVGQA